MAEFPPPPVSASVHIYRGLLDRAYTWRVRVDAPTNWAVITSGTAASFVLGSPQHSHAVLLLNMVFSLSFLFIEARRIRYYDLWSNWVRLLETEYFVPILRDQEVTINDMWQQIMVRDMAYPHFKTKMRYLVGRRLRDNYLALYTFLLLCWLLKLSLHPRPDLPKSMADTFIDRASIGPIPGLVVMAMVFLVFIGLIVFLLLSMQRREASSEVMSAERIMQKMASPAQQPISRRKWQHEEMGQSPYDPSDISPID